MGLLFSLFFVCMGLFGLASAIFSVFSILMMIYLVLTKQTKELPQPIEFYVEGCIFVLIFSPLFFGAFMAGINGICNSINH
jgi:hypothetical protein